MTGYLRVKQILDESVNGEDFGAHGPFWRGLTRDQFIVQSVFGRKVIATRPDGTFDPEESNLVKALEGRAPFGEDLTAPPPGALFPRMPFGYPPVPSDRIDEIRNWIAAGCPDQLPTPAGWIDPQRGGALADPTLHNNFFRDFDNWAMFQASPQTMADIDTFFGVADKWFAFSHDGAQESSWVAELQNMAVVESVGRLEQRQRETVTAHYGRPVPLLTLLDGFERFGDNSLPDDQQRPQDVRHNMNGRIMWFFWAAFADACLRMEATASIPAEFWHGMMRALLIGMMNDGLFRGRFTVKGFEASPDGMANVRAYVMALDETDLPQELATRCVESGVV